MRRRTTRRLGILLAAASLTLGAACGDPSAGPRELNALQAAADAVDDATSSRLAMTMTMQLNGLEVTADMDGLFDYSEERGELTMTIDVPVEVPGSEGINHLIVDGRFTYVKGPAAGPLYGGTGNGWIRMDMSDMPGMGSQMNQDPRQYIEFLRAAGGSVENVGSETIGAEPTTHYRAEVSFEDLIEVTQDANTRAFAEQLEEMAVEVEESPIDAWIGEDGLPRRIRSSMSMSGVDGLPGDGEMTIEIELDLSDYGVPVNVKIPKEFEEVSVPAG